MSVVNETTKTLFGKRGGSRRATRAAPKKASVTVLKVTMTKTDASKAATAARRTHKTGRIQVKKAPGGWMVVWYK
jgi:hypothetical protein